MGSHDLWQEYCLNRDSAVKEKLIVHYISLVQKIVGKMAGTLPAHIDRDDLYSYGIFGLLEAIDRYNPNLGVPFSGFAMKRVKGAIIDGLRKEDWLPITVRQRAKKVERAYEKVERNLGRNATDEEIAQELGISTLELGEWLREMQYITILSLDQPCGQEQEYFLKENFTDSESPNPLQIIIEKEIKNILVQTIEKLPDKEKIVISLFYFHNLANNEIAQVMELSPSRISQLHTKAIFRLRGKLGQLKKK